MRRRSSLALLGVPLLCLAQTPAADQPIQSEQRGREFLGLAPPPDAAAAARGEKVYSQSCSFCHGAKANGAEGPNLIRSTVVLHDDKGELIGVVVRNGRPDRGMPAFPGLSAGQIFDIAEFLHARVEAAANRYTYKVGNIVTGDPKAGRTFFETAGHCAECHSITGDLAHVAAKYDAADLQAQFLFPSYAKPLLATVVLSSGQKITGKLKRIDDFDVSLWDEEGVYHSWPREAVEVTVKDPLAEHRALLDRYTDQDMHNMLAYLETLK